MGCVAHVDVRISYIVGLVDRVSWKGVGVEGTMVPIAWYVGVREVNKCVGCRYEVYGTEIPAHTE